jgi:hypothetical protein
MNSTEMRRNQIVNHFQNVKDLLLKAAMLSKNSKFISVIEKIDQIIDSKNQTSEKEHSMLSLHKKVDRIDQLLEKQNVKNEKRNVQNVLKNQELNVNVIRNTNSNDKEKAIIQSKSDKFKQINHETA